MRATSTIPIVVLAVGDPVRTGLVKSLTRPGGNLTAVVHIAPDLSAKRVELLKELAPRVRRVAMLWNPANPHNPLQWHATQAAAKTLGLQAYSFEVQRDEDLELAFSHVGRREVGGLIFAADNLLHNLRSRIAEQALLQRLPAVGPERSFAHAGGLASYGPDFVEIYRQAGVYAGKILGGAKVAELPVQQPTKFDLVINLKTAKALGLTIPPSLLLRADRVIE
jgi:putative ABC transport system substrate-binding protein